MAAAVAFACVSVPVHPSPSPSPPMPVVCILCTFVLHPSRASAPARHGTALVQVLFAWSFVLARGALISVMYATYALDDLAKLKSPQ